MARTSNRTVDVSKLECKEYNSFAELCEQLGWGASKDTRMRHRDWYRIKKYCKLERLECSKKVRITEIYEQPLG